MMTFSQIVRLIGLCLFLSSLQLSLQRIHKLRPKKYCPAARGNQEQVEHQLAV